MSEGDRFLWKEGDIKLIKSDEPLDPEEVLRAEKILEKIAKKFGER